MPNVDRVQAWQAEAQAALAELAAVVTVEGASRNGKPWMHAAQSAGAVEARAVFLARIDLLKARKS